MYLIEFSPISVPILVLCYFVVTQWKLCDSVTIFNMATDHVLLLIGDIIWIVTASVRFEI